MQTDHISDRCKIQVSIILLFLEKKSRTAPHHHLESWWTVSMNGENTKNGRECTNTPGQEWASTKQPCLSDGGGWGLVPALRGEWEHEASHFLAVKTQPLEVSGRALSFPCEGGSFPHPSVPVWRTPSTRRHTAWNTSWEKKKREKNTQPCRKSWTEDSSSIARKDLRKDFSCCKRHSVIGEPAAGSFGRTQPVGYLF